MEQKLHRVIRACLEMGEQNPILTIHDQGAGGNGLLISDWSLEFLSSCGTTDVSFLFIVS